MELWVNIRTLMFRTTICTYSCINIYTLMFLRKLYSQLVNANHISWDNSLHYNFITVASKAVEECFFALDMPKMITLKFK